MKFFLVVMIGMIFLDTLTTAPQTASAQVIQVQSTAKPLVAGSNGIVNIHLMIKEGFKIPRKPAPKIQIDSTPPFEVKGDLNLVGESQNEAPEYFKQFKVLALQVKVADTISAGKYSLKGKLAYFYCSEKDKYCSRAIENLQLPLEVLDKQ
jgi:hypothetical protein